MNCYKGLCKYKTDNSDLCLKDKDNGLKPQKCDLHKDGQLKKCRYGYTSCQDNCYWYPSCTET